MVISMKQKIKYSIFLLLLLVLMDILLYQNAIKTTYLIMFSLILAILWVGENDSIDVVKLGFGITRKEIEVALLKDLLYILILSIIILTLNSLFIYILNHQLNMRIRYITFIYIISWFIGLLILLIKRNFQNKKVFIFSLLLFIITLILIFLIKNYIIASILIVVLIIILYLLWHFIINKNVFILILLLFFLRYDII